MLIIAACGWTGKEGWPKAKAQGKTRIKHVVDDGFAENDLALSHSIMIEGNHQLPILGKALGMEYDGIAKFRSRSSPIGLPTALFEQLHVHALERLINIREHSRNASTP